MKMTTNQMMKLNSRIKISELEKMSSTNKILRSFKMHYFKDFQWFVGKSRQTFAKIKQNSEKISKYAKSYLQTNSETMLPTKWRIYFIDFFISNTKNQRVKAQVTLWKTSYSHCYTLSTLTKWENDWRYKQ